MLWKDHESGLVKALWVPKLSYWQNKATFCLENIHL